ncbi:MAG: SEC-C domain-containing protein [Bradymonadaceae bacterium]|nr:SEC-C domain-containing protein [Lujinxingiaceae bacterium]
MAAETGRNEPCPCGSGQKYKRCCLAKDQDAVRSTSAAQPMAKPLPVLAQRPRGKQQQAMNARERSDFERALNAVLAACALVLKLLRSKYRIDYMADVLSELDIEARRLPDDRLENVIIPLAVLGTSGELFYDYPLVARAIRAQLARDPVSLALFVQLTSRPYEAWCNHPTSQPSGPGMTHTIFGPASEHFLPYDATVARAATDRDHSALVGIPVQWKRWTVLFAIEGLSARARWDLDGIALQWQEIEDVATFAREFEWDLIYSAADPNAQYGSAGRRFNPVYREPSASDVFVEIVQQLGVLRGVTDSEQLTLNFLALSTPAAFEAFDASMVEAFETVMAPYFERDAWADKFVPDEVRTFLRCAPEPQIEHLRVLQRRPLALLLLDTATLARLGLDRLAAIDEALGRSDDVVLHQAWQAYVLEQRWVHYMADRDTNFMKYIDVLGFAERAMVANFYALALTDLPMKTGDLNRIERGLQALHARPATFKLGDLPATDRALAALPGVGKTTQERIRAAVLELAALWRWEAAGLDPRTTARAAASRADHALLAEGLAELAELLDPEDD